MSNESNSGRVFETSLKSLKLRPGLLLQIRPLVGAAAAVEAQFLAGLPGKGLMTAPHDISYEIKAGLDYSVRGFTGLHDFEFVAPALQTFTDPFPYALLRYPDTVRARIVRKAPRMRAQLAAAVSSPGRTGLPVQLIDLSVAGALAHSTQALGNIGDQVALGFALDVQDAAMELRLTAQIAHSAEADDGFRVGLMFKNIGRNDVLALHYFATTAAADAGG